MTDVIEKHSIRFEPFLDCNNNQWLWLQNATSSGQVKVYCPMKSIEFHFDTVIHAQLFCDLILTAKRGE